MAVSSNPLNKRQAKQARKPSSIQSQPLLYVSDRALQIFVVASAMPLLKKVPSNRKRERVLRCTGPLWSKRRTEILCEILDGNLCKGVKLNQQKTHVIETARDAVNTQTREEGPAVSYQQVQSRYDQILSAYRRRGVPCRQFWERGTSVLDGRKLAKDFPDLMLVRIRMCTLKLADAYSLRLGRDQKIQETH